MSATSSPIVGAKSRGRSRLSNGALFATVDGRSTWARLMRDTFSALVTHCGGVDVVSETRRLAARRVSVIESELVFLEDKFATLRATGGAPDAAELDLYGRLADRQRRLSESLGWERTPRDVTPTLAQYLASKAAVAADSTSAPATPSTTIDADKRTTDVPTASGAPHD